MASRARRADVIVIGAGMSGVAAAQSLRQFDDEIKVIVLEGRDRIGGRIWSYREWPEAPIELGASWVSHLTINPLGLVAKEKNIKLVDSNLTNVALRRANGYLLTRKAKGGGAPGSTSTSTRRSPFSCASTAPSTRWRWRR